MGFVVLDELEKAVVTPKHSTAYGEVVTGDNVELGRLKYKEGEGANMHSHPHEQIMVVLSGRVRMTLNGEVQECGPGTGFHAAPHQPHRLEALEDSVVISCKNVLDGAGHKI